MKLATPIKIIRELNGHAVYWRTMLRYQDQKTLILDRGRVRGYRRSRDSIPPGSHGSPDVRQFSFVALFVSIISFF
jgi:hypothetical protein